MFQELNRDSLRSVASLLPNLDRLRLAETCREGRRLVDDVGMRGAFASEVRSLSRPPQLDGEELDRLNGLKKIRGFASGLDGALGKAARDWELTEPQYTRARNMFLTRDAPDAIQKLAEVYPDEICDLGHLRKEHGSSLRDWLNSEDARGPVCVGQNEYDHCFLSLRIRSDRHASTGVLAWIWRDIGEAYGPHGYHYIASTDCFIHRTPFCWATGVANEPYTPWRGDKTGFISEPYTPWGGPSSSGGVTRTWLEAMQSFLSSGEIVLLTRRDMGSYNFVLRPDEPHLCRLV